MTPAQAAIAAAVEGAPFEKPSEPWTEDDGWFLVRAAGNNRAEAIRELAKAGLSLDSRGEGGQTSLHASGYMGWAETVQTLLELGADPTLRDRWHNGTPLGWCVVGSAQTPPLPGNHPATVRLLLQAGLARLANVEWLLETAKNRPDVLQVLAEFGIA